MHIPTPSWLLLLWCGLAAALASEWVAAMFRALIARPPSRDRAGTPRLLAKPRGSVPFAILSGTLVFAPLYGLVFEWMHRADLETGALIGAVHGALAGTIVMISLLRHRNQSPTTAVRPMALYRARRLLTRVLYGAFLGFLYVVPGS